MLEFVRIFYLRQGSLRTILFLLALLLLLAELCQRGIPGLSFENLGREDWIPLRQMLEEALADSNGEASLGTL